jgi:hypothetical protein
LLYEDRVYHIMPGKAQALHKRFEHLTDGIFKKHGFRVVGYWTELIGDSGVLRYLLAWEDLNEREAKWAAFGSDPDWRRGREESEQDGPLVARIVSTIWRPTPYSPMQ